MSEHQDAKSYVMRQLGRMMATPDGRAHLDAQEASRFVVAADGECIGDVMQRATRHDPPVCIVFSRQERLCFMTVTPSTQPAEEQERAHPDATIGMLFDATVQSGNQASWFIYAWQSYELQHRQALIAGEA